MKMQPALKHALRPHAYCRPPAARDTPTWQELEDTFARWEALGLALREEPL
jgi:hypothetical protein